MPPLFLACFQYLVVLGAAGWWAGSSLSFRTASSWEQEYSLMAYFMVLKMTSMGDDFISV